MDPRSGAARKNLGITLLKLDRPCEAFAHLERSKELRPGFISDDRLRVEIPRLRSQCNQQ